MQTQRSPVSWQATLRVFNAPHLHAAISNELGIQPTKQHHKGDPLNERFPFITDGVFTKDAWLLTAPVPEIRLLDEHLTWHTNLLRQHVVFMKQLKSGGSHIDISCTCKLRDGTTHFSISSDQIDMLSSLGIQLTYLVIRA